MREKEEKIREGQKVARERLISLVNVETRRLNEGDKFDKQHV